MAIVSIGTNSGKSATNLTITVPAGGVPAGALIVVCTSAFSGSAPSSVPADSASNTYHDAGSIANGTSAIVDVAYCWNCAALVSGNTITVHYTSTNYATSAFYWDGAATAADPRDSAAQATNTGNSSAFTATMAHAPAVASSLIVGAVSVNAANPTFTQDSTNASYATPPVLVSTSGGSNNVTVAGGTVISSSLLTYAPSITNVHLWAEIIVVFKPPSGNTFQNSGVFSGAGDLEDFTRFSYGTNPEPFSGAGALAETTRFSYGTNPAAFSGAGLLSQTPYVLFTGAPAFLGAGALSEIPGISYGTNLVSLLGAGSLLAVPPSGVKIVQTAWSDSDFSPNTVTSTSTIMTSAVTAGNAVAIFTSVPNSGSPTITISDDKSNTYTLGPTISTGAAGHVASGYYLLNCINGPTTFTVACPQGTYMFIVAVELSGVHGFDAGSANQSSVLGTFTTFNSGSFTTSNANDLLISLGIVNNGGAAVVSTGLANVALGNSDPGATPQIGALALGQATIGSGAGQQANFTAASTVGGSNFDCIAMAFTPVNTWLNVGIFLAAGLLTETPYVRFVGTIPFTGAGNLTETTRFTYGNNPEAFAGTGLLAESPYVQFTGIQPFLGAGSLTEAPYVQFTGTMPFAGAGLLSESPYVQFTGVMPFLGAGLLTESPYVQFTGTIPFTGVGLLSESPYIQFTGVQPFLGAGNLAEITGFSYGNNPEAFAGAGLLTESPYIQFTGTQAFLGAGLLTESPYVQFTGTIPFLGVGTFGSGPTPLLLAATAVFNGSGLFAAIRVGTNTWINAALFSGAGALIASPYIQFTGTQAFLGVGNLNVPQPPVLLAASELFAGAGTFASPSVLSLPAFANFAGAGLLAETVVLRLPAFANFAGAGLLSESPYVQFTGTQVFAGAGTLAEISGFSYGSNPAAFAGAGLLASSQPVVLLQAVASFAGAGLLNAAGTLLLPTSALFSGAGLLNANPTLRFVGTANFAGAGLLSETSGFIYGTNLAAFLGNSTFLAIQGSAHLWVGTALLSGAGAFAASGVLLLPVSAILSGAGAFAAGPTQFIYGTNPQVFGGSGNLAETVSMQLAAATSFVGAGSLLASPALLANATTSFAGSGSLGTVTQFSYGTNPMLFSGLGNLGAAAIQLFKIVVDFALPASLSSVLIVDQYTPTAVFLTSTRDSALPIATGQLIRTDRILPLITKTLTFTIFTDASLPVGNLAAIEAIITDANLPIYIRKLVRKVYMVDDAIAYAQLLNELIRVLYEPGGR